jgi:hypothetical protein
MVASDPRVSGYTAEPACWTDRDRIVPGLSFERNRRLDVALSRCRIIRVERAVAPQIVQSLPVQEQIAHWLVQAAEARSVADGFKSHEARRSMFEVARAYEHMARQLEQLLPGALAA